MVAIKDTTKQKKICLKKKDEKNKISKLILFNDDINTFEFIIDSLKEVCNHTDEQAEQCAMIAHYKGKCAIKNGEKTELKKFYNKLSTKGITVEIK